MVDLHCSGTALRGIFHWQSPDELTDYGMVMTMSDLLGIDASGIMPVNDAPAARSHPKNAQLDGSRLEKLLAGRIPARMPFHEGLKSCLAPFLEADANRDIA